LKRTPEVRRFLKDSGHADLYENLEVKFVPGKTATLFLYDDAGSQVESIVLSEVTFL
jgi:hypothetical protein